MILKVVQLFKLLSHLNPLVLRVSMVAMVARLPSIVTKKLRFCVFFSNWSTFLSSRRFFFGWYERYITNLSVYSRNITEVPLNPLFHQHTKFYDQLKSIDLQSPSFDICVSPRLHHQLTRTLGKRDKAQTRLAEVFLRYSLLGNRHGPEMVLSCQNMLLAFLMILVLVLDVSFWGLLPFSGLRRSITAWSFGVTTRNSSATWLVRNLWVWFKAFID